MFGKSSRKVLSNLTLFFVINIPPEEGIQVEKKKKVWNFYSTLHTHINCHVIDTLKERFINAVSYYWTSQVCKRGSIARCEVLMERNQNNKIPLSRKKLTSPQICHGCFLLVQMVTTFLSTLLYKTNSFFG